MSKKRGVSKTSLHLFRHTFAKNWILAKEDIFKLQKILGHQSLKMVNHYLNIYGSDFKQDFDSFNVLELVTSSNKKITIKGNRR